MDKIKITIDGIETEVEKGTTVIQAADQLGIEIPRYCYHPGLSIVGQCRICLVEIERMPKLQVACYTPVTDGMVVRTRSENAVQARQAVLEFLLINHPLDCPVCDQAGECWLQNFYMQHGLYDSRMVEDKVKKHKALPIGPHVVLDSERCILCSRCVRFCDEISKTHELGIFNRGDHAELLPYPGRELDNKYSGNTIDICPVGALTDRDFRFRTRVWYLSETPSVCPGCSTGCNIFIHHNDQRPYKAGGVRISRLKPRYNPHVNDWWMCDEGRYGFGFVDADDRLIQPQKRVADEWQELTWEDAEQQVIDKLLSAIDKHGREAAGVILSPHLTNEDLFLAMRLFRDGLQLQHIDFELQPRTPGYSDDFLIRADKSPNSRGAKEIAQRERESLTVAEMLRAAKNGRMNVLYVCQQDLAKGFEDKEIEAALSKLDLLIYQGSNMNAVARRADFILPGATFAEKDGTFTNYAGRVQRIFKAVAPPQNAREDWRTFKRLARRLRVPVPYFEPEDVFNAIAETVPAFKGLSYAALGEHGAMLYEAAQSEHTEEAEKAA